MSTIATQLACDRRATSVFGWHAVSGLQRSGLRWLTIFKPIVGNYSVVRQCFMGGMPVVVTSPSAVLCLFLLLILLIVNNNNNLHSTFNQYTYLHELLRKTNKQYNISPFSGWNYLKIHLRVNTNYNCQRLDDQ